MKKWIVGIVITILALGAFAGVGFTAYRIGFNQGARTTQDVRATDNFTPPFVNRFNRENMPQFNPGMNDRNGAPGFAPDHFLMMQRGGRMGFFSPFQFLWRIVLFGLITWLGYQLFRGNGWHLSLTRHQVAEPVENTETSSPKRKSTESDG